MGKSRADYRRRKKETINWKEALHTSERQRVKKYCVPMPNP